MLTGAPTVQRLKIALSSYKLSKTTKGNNYVLKKALDPSSASSNVGKVLQERFDRTNVQLKHNKVG